MTSESGTTERWLEQQIELTERQLSEQRETPPGKPMNPVKANFAGFAHGLKVALYVVRNGVPQVVPPIVSVLQLPCGRTVGTEAPMPDGHTICSCGTAHPRQPTAEQAAPWMVPA